MSKGQAKQYMQQRFILNPAPNLIIIIIIIIVAEKIATTILPQTGRKVVIREQGIQRHPQFQTTI